VDIVNVIKESSMTLEEAIQWIDPDTRDPKIDDLDNSNGVDTADILIGKFNEAGRVAAKELRYIQQFKEWIKE